MLATVENASQWAEVLSASAEELRARGELMLASMQEITPARLLWVTHQRSYMRGVAALCDFLARKMERCYGLKWGFETRRTPINYLQGLLSRSRAMLLLLSRCYTGNPGLNGHSPVLILPHPFRYCVDALQVSTREACGIAASDLERLMQGHGIKQLELPDDIYWWWY